MKRTHAVHIGEMLRNFYTENPQLRQKILEVRIQRGWDEMIEQMIARSTQNIFIKNRILHVSLNSSVLRNELLLHRTRLVKNLNEYAGEEVIVDIVIR